MIDYRELLKKYMMVVAEIHGHDFLPYCSGRPEFDLSDEEFDELDHLSKEAGTA